MTVVVVAGGTVYLVASTGVADDARSAGAVVVVVGRCVVVVGRCVVVVGFAVVVVVAGTEVVVASDVVVVSATLVVVTGTVVVGASVVVVSGAVVVDGGAVEVVGSGSTEIARLSVAVFQPSASSSDGAVLELLLEDEVLLLEDDDELLLVEDELVLDEELVLLDEVDELVEDPGVSCEVLVPLGREGTTGSVSAVRATLSGIGGAVVTRSVEVDDSSTDSATTDGSVARLR